MWASSSKGQAFGKRLGGSGLIAVAIDKDKGSQYAIKWAVDNLLSKGQTVILIHVSNKTSSAAGNDAQGIAQSKAKELFLTFHCFCSRKDIQCFDVMLEDSSIAKAIAEYVSYSAIDNLVLGSSRHGFIRRLKSVDVPTAVLKAAPDFCTVYVISKTKISSVRNASRNAPYTSPLYDQIYPNQSPANSTDQRRSFDSQPKPTFSMRAEAIKTPPQRHYSTRDDLDSARSSISKGPPSFLLGKLQVHGDLSESESDISFVSSNRPSSDQMSALLHDGIEPARTSRLSVSSDSSFGSELLGSKGSEFSFAHDQFSSSSLGSDDVESEMKRLKIELLKTMDLYSVACKEAISAKQKASELQRWRMEEEKRIHEANNGEEESHDNRKVRSATPLEEIDPAHRIEMLEKHKRLNAEMQEHKMYDHCNFRYRRYTIEEIEEATEYFAEAHKIGEGGYGPVFRCSLDHTVVAVKVLRPDANQGRSQFHQEVEVLSCMRHPNLVLLLGACPEYGCLVYEYLGNGSLEDRLFRKGNTPALSWQIRFRILAEIGTGLLFLHRTKPEPIVHRDLKPANILLDHNFVSKISDVGLARLVPPSVSDDVTQCRMTSAAGTFCYIDPEYQQTGMLGVKSDIYSLGIIMLQVLTAKPAMGIAHTVEDSIENDRFTEMLDPHVPDWPIEEALGLAKLSLQCAELRRKDRPDLGKIILPELCKLRDLGDEKMVRPYVQ